MKEITVGAVQMASKMGDAAANAEVIVGWADRAARQGADLVFFPECSLTGYTTDRAAERAVRIDDEAACQVERFAAQRGIAIGYGFAEKREGFDKPFITYVVASADGRLCYRKTHLGASEAASYEAGDELVVAQVAGVRVGVQLCWEGHICDIATTLRAKGAELLLAPHAGGLGGARRLQAWARYLPARAVDNGLFVVACNALRNGSAASEKHADAESGGGRGGGLAAYGPNGELMTSYDQADEHLMLVEVGGRLPREAPSGGMRGISYFDRRRPELYSR